ncbi:hypothetical protein LCGC14_1271890 [marine sediment metagenome]|uniref:Uncharacterized protein n=1 Tax=marine sediment metagenome TaxID=412755 RepID=A0A0F9KZM2_9ZZZZ
MGRGVEDKMEKKCFRCGEIINDRGEYFIFQEMNDGKLIATDYCHKTCWNQFLHQISKTEEAMGMMRGMKSKMQKMGILPAEVVEIQ